MSRASSVGETHAAPKIAASSGRPRSASSRSAARPSRSIAARIGAVASSATWPSSPPPPPEDDNDDGLTNVAGDDDVGESDRLAAATAGRAPRGSEASGPPPRRV